MDGGDTRRLEALTDGIFAIAMTLLVLQLTVPESGRNLHHDLRLELPDGLSYAVSFVILGVYWVGHRSQFQLIERADRTLTWLNILFLMGIALIPFSAALLGRHHETETAVVVYGSNLVAVAILHLAMWLYATRVRRLVAPGLPAAAILYGTRLSVIAPAIYLVAIALAPVSTAASIAVYAAVPLLYATGLAYRVA